MMRNLAIRAQEGEQMDSPDLPEPVYREVLGGLRRINAATLANRPTLDFLSRAARRDRPFRLLDVGFGDGGMLRSKIGRAHVRNPATNAHLVCRLSLEKK